MPVGKTIQCDQRLHV